MNRCLKIFQIDADLLFAMFRQGVHPEFEVVDNGIPDDAELVNVRVSFDGCRLELCVRSDYFPEVPEGHALSNYSPVCKRLPGSEHTFSIPARSGVKSP